MLLKTQYLKAIKYFSIAFILISFIWSAYYTHTLISNEEVFSYSENNSFNKDSFGYTIIVYLFAFVLGAYWNMGCIRKLGIV